MTKSSEFKCGVGKEIILCCEKKKNERVCDYLQKIRERETQMEMEMEKETESDGKRHIHKEKERDGKRNRDRE